MYKGGLSQLSDKVVVRNAAGRLIETHTLPPHKTRKESLRQVVRAMTNDGVELVLTLLEISRGTAYTVKLSDGRESEPIIPTVETRLAATNSLLDRVWGKPVAQTEVVKAEAESIMQDQLAAMSNEDLLEAARPLIEAYSNGGGTFDGNRYDTVEQADSGTPGDG